MSNSNKLKGFCCFLQIRLRRKDLMLVVTGCSRLCRLNVLQRYKTFWGIQFKACCPYSTESLFRPVTGLCSTRLSHLELSLREQPVCANLSLSFFQRENCRKGLIYGSLSLLYVGLAGWVTVTWHLWTKTSAPGQLNGLQEVLIIYRIPLCPLSDFFNHCAHILV